MRLGTVVLWSVLLLVGASAQDISSLISKSMFESMLPNRNDGACPARGFYTYEAFIEAAKSFGAFANTGDIETRKREIVAFLGQTSHQTTGGWDAASNGTYSWGYCYKESTLQIDRCVTCEGGKWPCVQGKQYYGRGPIQLSYNCNYGQAGDALGLDLLEYPELVAIDPIISFQAAFWFWMTPQPPKPSCHEVMTGEWTPSEADIEAGRFPGYGLCTNIITGGGECGKGDNQFMENRIGFYKHFCDMMGLDYGEYLDCANQTPYGNGIESMIHLAENKSPQ